MLTTIDRPKKGKSFHTDDREIVDDAWNLFSAGQPAKVLRGGADVHFDGVKSSLL